MEASSAYQSPVDAQTIATRTSESASAGPAPGRPVEAVCLIRQSSNGALRMEEVSNFCPAIAVPMTVKIPEPITAPMPRAVSETGPSVFFRRRSGCSESDISLSIDLQQKSWFSEVRMVGSGDGVGCDKRLILLECSLCEGLPH